MGATIKLANNIGNFFCMDFIFCFYMVFFKKEKYIWIYGSNIYAISV